MPQGFDQDAFDLELRCSKIIHVAAKLSMSGSYSTAKWQNDLVGTLILIHVFDGDLGHLAQVGGSMEAIHCSYYQSGVTGLWVDPIKTRGGRVLSPSTLPCPCLGE